MKKILRMMLGILFVAAMIMADYTSVDAAEQVVVDDEELIASGSYENVTWKIDSDGLLTVEGTGECFSSDWYPYADKIKSAKVKLSNVTDLSYMFSDCSSLSNIDLSELDTMNVTDMAGMFDGCENLTNVDLSGFNTSNVTYMYSMFYGCKNLTSIDVSGFDTSKVTDMHTMFEGCESLISLDVSGFDTHNVTDMTRMFSGCTNLTSLNLSGFDTSNVIIMESMFAGCANLAEVDVSDFDTSNVEFMPMIFSGCSSLTSLDMSKFDISKVRYAFGLIDDCDSLSQIQAPVYCSVEINLPAGSDGEKWYMPDGTEVTALPQGLTESVLLTKGNKENLPVREWTYEVLEDGTAEITGYQGDSTELVIPETIDGYVVTVIGESAFAGKSCLNSVEIPFGVKRINDYAFYGCSYLKNVEISKNISYIGKCAFAYDTCMENITVAEDNENYMSEDGILFDKDQKTLLQYPASHASTSYVIPSGVTHVKEAAFGYNQNLVNVEIPASVVSIEKNAFDFCANLESVLVAEDNKNYMSEDGNLFTKDQKTFIQYIARKKGMSSYVIPFAVTAIGDNAFRDSYSLKEIEISDTVTYIGESAFRDSYQLKKVKLPASVMFIGDYAFYGCIGLKNLRIQNPECEIADSEYTIEEATVIYGYANSTAQLYAEKYGRTFVDIASHSHTYGEGEITVQTTCSKSGIRTYTCIECGEFYTESIPMKAHSYETTVAKAQIDKNGKIATACKSCGAVESTTDIYAIKTVSLSKDRYAYNGKVQKPTVTVKDSEGKKLRKNKDYTVIYAKGCKNPGSYTVTVTFKGNYTGTETLNFEIAPKTPEISSLKAQKKGFQVKWKKVDQISGYEIEYSTNKKFKKSKTKSVTVKASAKSKKVAKLSAKKKYFVRLRVYKNVKVDGKSVKLYSAWSKVKNITTKK